MFRLIIVGILFLISITTRSQEIGSNFYNKKANKIVHRITKDNNTDLEKVTAIHDWICKKIKYDLKKAQKFDFRTEGISKVLCKRKATCKGYSELFYYMCNAIGIKAEKVSGYSKNINIDVNDKFYLEDHQWNSVLIDSSWKLFDVCWDAGYIKYTKQTFIGKIFNIFSFGKYDIVKYKPHFVSAPHKNYFNRDGDFFIYDHIPGNAIWQLSNPFKSIKELESDSSYYFGINNYRLSPKDNLNQFRFNFSNQSNEAKIIQDGFDKYRFNNKNQFPIAISNYLLAKMNFKSLMKLKREDSLNIFKMVDTINFFIENSLANLDSNAYFISLQKQELFFSNSDKKVKFKFDNNKLYKSTIKSFYYLKSGRRICSAAKKTIISTNKNLNIRLNRLLTIQKFEKTKFAKTTSFSDSILFSKNICQINDSIRLLNDSIRQSFKFINNLYLNIISRMSKYSKQVKKSANETKSNHIKRMSCYDNYDFEILRDKDLTIEDKLNGDSLLQINSDFILKVYYKELLRIKSKLNKLFQFHKNNLYELCYLKKACSPNDNLDIKYESNLQKFENEFSEYLPLIIELISNYENLEHACNIQSKHTKKEWQAYKTELYIETNMSRVRQAYYSNHYLSLVKINRNQISDVQKLKKELKKYKRRINLKYE
jgi:hypothetical protein